VALERSYTKTFNLSRYLLMVLETRGLDAMTEEATRCASFIAENTTDNKELNSRLQIIVQGILGSIYGPDTEKIFRAQMEITEEFVNEPDPDQKVRLFARDLTAYLRHMEEGERDRLFSQRVITFVKELPTEELQTMTVDVLAQCFCYSSGHFSTRFKEETGKKITDVLANEWLNRAFELLNQKGLKPSVKEVTEMVGFSDPYYFSQLFKKRFGILPSDLVP